MGHLVDELIARTHELLQPNPGLFFPRFVSRSFITYLLVCLLCPAVSWIKKKYAGREVAIQQTAADFRQRRLWMLKILILLLNFQKVGCLAQILHLLDNSYLQCMFLVDFELFKLFT